MEGRPDVLSLNYFFNLFIVAVVANVDCSHVQHVLHKITRNIIISCWLLTASMLSKLQLPSRT